MFDKTTKTAVFHRILRVMRGKKTEMEKMKKCGLYAIAIVVYINIGILVAYSLDGGVEQTTATHLVRRLVDWLDVLGPTQHTARDPIIILIWPVLVGVGWLANMVYALWMAGATIWATVVAAAKWLFFGDFWKWLGIIKG